MAKRYSENSGIFRFFYSNPLKYLFLTLFFAANISLVASAQEKEYIRSPWWLGVATGGNFDLYHGGFPHQLNADTEVSGAFGTGKGTGYFAFPILEYHPEDKNWGFFLQAGYDSRVGTFNNELTTKLAYFTIEPCLRLDFPVKPFYIYAGPRLAVNVDKRFTYQQNSGTLDNMKKTVSAFQVGAGVDIHLTPKEKNSQVIMAPFFAFQPYFGQSPRTTDSWNVTTLRAGIAIKFGRSHQFAESRQVVVPVTIDEKEGTSVVFNEPPTTQEENTVDKTVPLGNQVYYDLMSSKIISPAGKQDNHQIRHLKHQMKDLAEEENLSDQMRGQMIGDDNFLTTLGRQMLKDQSATVELVGSSKNGAVYAESLAKSAKIFLTGVFGIDGHRIKIKSQKKLKTHFGKQKDREDLALLFEKDRQLLLRSNSASLQGIFRENSGGAVNPLKMKAVHEPEIDGFISFDTTGAAESFASWSLKISDGNGNTQNYGPYTGEIARIAKRKIMGDNTVGEYKVSMIGQLNSGRTVSKDTTVFFRIYPLNSGKKYTRFGISYEFNNLQSLNDLKRYLTEVVAPEIPENANVVIHGHSNSVDDVYFDLKRYLSAANDARDILQNALVKAGRNNVQFEVYGLGDDQIVEPFRKQGADRQHYYRTLVIDVVSVAK